MIPPSASAPLFVAEELLRAEGFTDIRYVVDAVRSSVVQVIASGDIDFGTNSRGRSSLRLDAGAPITAWRVPYRMLRAVRARAYPHHRRPEGQKVGINALGSGKHCTRDHGGAGRARPSQGHRMGRRSLTTRAVFPMELFVERQGRCVPRVPARAAGAARPQDRSRDRQHDHGQAVVAVLLLHAGRRTGNSSAIIRSPPSACCAPFSRPPTSAPPSRSGRRNVWSMAGSRAIRLRAPDADRASVRPAGASSTPRTRCASTRCGSTRSA